VRSGLTWHRIGPEAGYCLRISYTPISANASTDNIKTSYEYKYIL
jgi:hypothetical protein